HRELLRRRPPRRRQGPAGRLRELPGQIGPASPLRLLLLHPSSSFFFLHFFLHPCPPPSSSPLSRHRRSQSRHSSYPPTPPRTHPGLRNRLAASRHPPAPRARALTTRSP